jgi:hypothetical protein
MIVFRYPSGSNNILKVRTDKAGCQTPLDIRLQLENAESLVTSSITPTLFYYDAFDFLNIEAELGIKPNTYYGLEIIQLSGSSDCQTLYRGEVYYVSGSDANTVNSLPFQSYTETKTEYLSF